MEYCCPRCHYTTQNKILYVNHLRRIRICKPNFESIEPQEVLHVLQQQNKKCVTIEDAPSILQFMDTSNKLNSNEYTELKQALVALESQVKSLLQNRISQNVFGFEDTMHIDDSFIKPFAEYPAMLITKIIKQIYFTDIIPGNRTMRKDTNGRIEVYRGMNRWEVLNKTKLVKRMIERALDVIEYHFWHELPEATQTYITNYHNDDAKICSELMDNVVLLIECGM